MPLELYNETLDDPPAEAQAEGFEGYDCMTEPTKLPDSMIREGENVFADVDLILQTRPALVFNTQLTRAALGAGSRVPKGAGFYDIPGFERLLVAADGKLLEVTDDANNSTSNVLTPTPSASVDSKFAQLVDRMFWSDGTLHWSLYSGGAWSHSTVATFSDASAMPTWGVIASHKFRLLALDPATGKIYASAVGQASAAADWVKTDNIRVGTGEGDPTVAIISGQAGLYVINERSAWLVDTSNASVASWTITAITKLAGCAEGKTAVMVGQDVLFLSALGVMSLGRLSTTDAINAAVILSTPIQSWIARINKSALAACWAVMWRDLYVLAVPIDSATVPSHFLVFNTTTRRWGSPWTCTLPKLTVSATDIDFAGWACGAVTQFGGDQQTLICDNTGRVLRFDLDADDDQSSASVTQDIVSHYTTKAWNHGLPWHLKQPFACLLEFFGSSAVVNVHLLRDGQDGYPNVAPNYLNTLVEDMNTNSTTFFPITFPLTFLADTNYTRTIMTRGEARYRSVSIQVVATANRLRQRAVRVTGFIDTPELS